MLNGAVKKEEKKKAEGILKKKKNCSIVYSLSNFSSKVKEKRTLGRW